MENDKSKEIPLSQHYSYLFFFLSRSSWVKLCQVLLHLGCLYCNFSPSPVNLGGEWIENSPLEEDWGILVDKNRK